jgi:hypothetical protein
VSDDYKGLVVVFEKDFGEERTNAIINAILQIKGVDCIQPQQSDFNHVMAVEQAKSELRKKLWEVLK